jgi:hypothetical protein
LTVERGFSPTPTKEITMRFAVSRSALLTVAAFGSLALLTAPAAATITPVNGTVTANSTNTALTRGGILLARCPTSTFAGRISADGRSASGNIDFSNRGATTCGGDFAPCEVRSSDARNTITFRSTASTAGASATGDVALDSDFTYNVSCLGGGLACTVSGPQTIRAAGTSRQGAGRTDSLVTDVRGLRCTEGGTANFTGTYRINEDISIS